MALNHLLRTFLSSEFFNRAEQEELGRMLEKYPKLVQKFALQPHLCYDLMGVWEENCLDLLLNDELVCSESRPCLVLKAATSFKYLY